MSDTSAMSDTDGQSPAREAAQETLNAEEAQDGGALGARGVPTSGGAPDASLTADAHAAHQPEPEAAPVETRPCAECGGATVAADVAGGDERPSLVRDNFGRFFSRDARVPFERAHVCVQCGAVRLFVDVARLKRAALGA